jgi:hypothetical protein
MLMVRPCQSDWASIYADLHVDAPGTGSEFSPLTQNVRIHGYGPLLAYTEYGTMPIQQ